MSFPHRTAFYLPDKNKIIKPDQCWSKDEYNNPTKIVMTSEDFSPTDDYIPLASTGLEDSEGNEIFEGHIIELWSETGIIKWNERLAQLQYSASYPEANSSINYGEIIGHALIDPELVPDSFDVEEYFDMELSNNE